ncbi:hypothetical protein Tco_1245502 [Tanacetum coccineum]
MVGECERLRDGKGSPFSLATAAAATLTRLRDMMTYIVDRPSPLMLLWVYLLSWAYGPWTAAMGSPLFKAREDDERPKESRQDQPNQNIASTVTNPVFPMIVLSRRQITITFHNLTVNRNDSVTHENNKASNRSPSGLAFCPIRITVPVKMHESEISEYSKKFYSTVNCVIMTTQPRDGVTVKDHEAGVIKINSLEKNKS